MEFLLNMIQGLGNVGETIVDVFNSIPTWFEQLFIWLNAWYVKAKLYFLIYSLKLSYQTAQYLINEIGFNDLLINVFNQLPSELRYYAFEFKIPQCLSMITNAFATAFVIKVRAL